MGFREPGEGGLFHGLQRAGERLSYRVIIFRVSENLVSLVLQGYCFMGFREPGEGGLFHGLQIAGERLSYRVIFMVFREPSEGLVLQGYCFMVFREPWGSCLIGLFCIYLTRLSETHKTKPCRTTPLARL